MKKEYCKVCKVRLKTPPKEFLASLFYRLPEKQEWIEFEDGFVCIECAKEFKQQQKTGLQKQDDGEFLGTGRRS